MVGCPAESSRPDGAAAIGVCVLYSLGWADNLAPGLEYEQRVHTDRAAQALYHCDLVRGLKERACTLREGYPVDNFTRPIAT